METKKEMNKIEIVSKYIDTILETGKKPASIYKFKKINSD